MLEFDPCDSEVGEKSKSTGDGGGAGVGSKVRFVVRMLRGGVEALRAAAMSCVRRENLLDD